LNVPEDTLFLDKMTKFNNFLLQKMVKLKFYQILH